MTTYKVGYFVGSLAKASINRQLAKALIRLSPAELEFTEIPIKDLPLYSYDYDADYPPVARALKQTLADVDAVLFVTPEYNRSIPGGLKNAIDWASRPWGQNSFTRKPSAVRRLAGRHRHRACTAGAAWCARLLQLAQMNSIEAYIQFNTRPDHRRLCG